MVSSDTIRMNGSCRIQTSEFLPDVLKTYKKNRVARFVNDGYSLEFRAKKRGLWTNLAVALILISRYVAR